MKIAAAKNIGIATKANLVSIYTATPSWQVGQTTTLLTFLSLLRRKRTLALQCGHII